jgi:UPF0755 protein
MWPLIFKYKIFVSISISLLIMLVLLSIDFSHALHAKVIKNTVLIEIEKGESFQQVIQKLVRNNVTINVFWFYVLGLQGHDYKKIKAGEYEFNSSLTMPEVLSMLVQGKTKRYSITFPEGWTFAQISQKISAESHLTHSLDFTNNALVMRSVGADSKHPEGAFFPDTYFFAKHTTDIDLLTRAYAKMQQVLHDEWLTKSNQVPFKTPYEALILASIVEKETASAQERAQIAGVFIRRLQQNIPLQTDPTVIYGMGEHYLGNISSKDLITATPYNTYTFKGLPPTPIAMPGQDAIHAVFHPDTGQSLYFVARGDGTHVFSNTLDAHNAAVTAYQRGKK